MSEQKRLMQLHESPVVSRDIQIDYSEYEELYEKHARLVALVREVAAQLERWADESQRGGWSTHQVKPQRQLAAKLYERVGRS